MSVENIEGQLETVEFLSRSPARVKVLDAIQEESRTRRELKGLTDVSRVTLSRILANFEDRGWINRTNGKYEINPEGEFVATELTQLLENMEMAEELDGAMQWLPIKEFDFDLCRLRDGKVTTADWGDHTAQIRRVADIIRGSDRIIGTASGVSRDVLNAVWETTVKDDSSFEGILDTTALDIVSSDPEIEKQFLDVMETGAEIHRYEGDKEPLIMLMICDDTVILCGHDQDGPPPGMFETTDERIRSWAESYFRSIRKDSVEMDSERWATPPS